eukprot:m.222569 g.222569  ORF g.222569 m.222569 type:complete len:1124 (-) comp25827_c0_seq2:84-3455(-)
MPPPIAKRQADKPPPGQGRSEAGRSAEARQSAETRQSADWSELLGPNVHQVQASAHRPVAAKHPITSAQQSGPTTPRDAGDAPRGIQEGWSNSRAPPTGASSRARGSRPVDSPATAKSGHRHRATATATATVTPPASHGRPTSRARRPDAADPRKRGGRRRSSEFPREGVGTDTEPSRDRGGRSNGRDPAGVGNSSRLDSTVQQKHHAQLLVKRTRVGARPPLIDSGHAAAADPPLTPARRTRKAKHTRAEKHQDKTPKIRASKHNRSFLTQHIQLTHQGSPLHEKKKKRHKDRSNKVSPIPLFEPRITDDPPKRSRRASDILDDEEKLSRILSLQNSDKNTSHDDLEGGYTNETHRNFRMVIAALFEEMAVFNVVGSLLHSRFADPKTEADFKNWKWDLMYPRYPTAIVWASAVYSVTMFVVMFVALRDEGGVLVIVMALHGGHTVVNAVLSIVSRRERLWSEVMHPGLLWSIGMRFIGVLGIGVVLEVIGPRHNDSELFLSPLLIATLLSVTLVLIESVAFGFPLITMASLTLLDVCCLGTVGVLEVLEGWHTVGQVAVILLFFVGIALLSFVGLKLDERTHREMYLALATHDKITSELAEERLTVQLKNAAAHDFTDNIERLIARGLPAQRKAVPAEIPRHCVDLREIVGKGAFGDVRRGRMRTAESETAVAVKTCNEANELERDKGTALTMLLEEATLMAQFRHPNVIRLLGVCTAGCLEGLTAMILMEYAEKGPLREYIRTNRKFQVLTDVTQFTMSLDIASGMRYLTELRFVHRDLAARNVLVMQDFTCKVADFGLSRFMGREGNYYRSNGGLLPIRWTPIEALERNKFTSASDVWSFGIVVFEIFSGASKPYGKMTNQQVWVKVKAGYRIPIPSGCPSVAYTDIMLPCWASRPSARPTFSQLVGIIDTALRTARRDRRPSTGGSMMSSLSVFTDPAYSGVHAVQRSEAPLWWDEGSQGTVSNSDLYNDHAFLALMEGELRRNVPGPEAPDVHSLAAASNDSRPAENGAGNRPPSPVSTGSPGLGLSRASLEAHLRGGPSVMNEMDGTPEPPPRPSVARTDKSVSNSSIEDSSQTYDNLYAPNCPVLDNPASFNGGSRHSSLRSDNDVYETPQARQV